MAKSTHGEQAFNEYCLRLRQARSWSDLSEEEQRAWVGSAAVVSKVTTKAVTTRLNKKWKERMELELDRSSHWENHNQTLR